MLARTVSEDKIILDRLPFAAEKVFAANAGPLNLPFPNFLLMRGVLTRTVTPEASRGNQKR